MAWSLGDVRIDGQVVLGPMSGFTSSAYRSFMTPFGASLCFTEMVSDMGVLHGMGNTRPFLESDPASPTAIQLFGSNPDSLAEAASAALKENPHAIAIDVNMGCPVEKVLRNGCGCALMRDPGLCGRIIEKVKESVDVPVTAKIRLGWSMEELTFPQVVEELQSAGVDCITVHPRTRADGYSGSPRTDLVAGLGDTMSVPLIISGNIFSRQDAALALETTGADAVMIARGGVGNPFLLTMIDRYLRYGEILDYPSVAQQMEWCERLSRMIVNEKGEELGMRILRAITPKFLSGCRYCRDYRLRLATFEGGIEDLAALLERISSKMGEQHICCHAPRYPDGRNGERRPIDRRSIVNTVN
ncbi:MAG: tRNA-dihydrouridine synthase [Candidatus Methanomethylophilaceae archaeon]|nr:tRNA-dihydrouridine synthase [Candidatus Methanomethylophilaceae archaeon]